MHTAKTRRLLRDVGRQIAGLRVSRNMTQERFAERLRVSTRYVRRIEAGEENLSLASLARIASCLRVPVARLFLPPDAAR